MTTTKTSLNSLIETYQQLYDAATETAEQSNFAWGYATALGAVIGDFEEFKESEEKTN